MPKFVKKGVKMVKLKLLDYIQQIITPFLKFHSSKVAFSWSFENNSFIDFSTLSLQKTVTYL